MVSRADTARALMVLKKHEAGGLTDAVDLAYAGVTIAQAFDEGLLGFVDDEQVDPFDQGGDLVGLPEMRRATALVHALEHHRGYSATAEEVVATARAFNDYLRGDPDEPVTA